MSKSMPRHIAFGISMIIWLAFPIYMIFSYENVLSEGTVYRFKPRPVDPYHPFQGRYITLNYDIDPITNEEVARQLDYGDRAYVSLAKGADGFAEFTGIYLTPPDEMDYITVETWHHGDDKISFRLPFDEYFLNEKMAPVAEDAYREATRNEEETDIYVNVRIKNGTGIIEELYIQGKPIMEFLKDQ